MLQGQIILIDHAELKHPIVSARIFLEPLMEGHADELFELLSDKKLFEFIDESPPESLEWLRARYLALESRISPDGEEIWLNWMVRQYDRKPLGYVQSTVYSEGKAEIAFVFAREFWGLSFAYEASKMMLAELENGYGIKSVYATVAIENVRSHRLLNRLGFVVIEAHLYPFDVLNSKDFAFQLDLIKLF